MSRATSGPCALAPARVAVPRLPVLALALARPRAAVASFPVLALARPRAAVASFPVLALVAGLVLPALAGCLRPGLESMGACESPVGEDGPGFVRHAYYARFEEAPEGGARFVVPMPLDERSEPAPVVACLLLHDGEATWRVVREADLPFLEVTVSSTSAVVRASYLIATFSNESIADTNWSIAPLERSLSGAPAPPSGSKSAFPIGETRAYAGVEGAVMRVYYAVDAGRADDGGEVAHRQDVFERRTQAGWQSPVVFREHQTLR